MKISLEQALFSQDHQIALLKKFIEEATQVEGTPLRDLANKKLKSVERTSVPSTITIRELVAHQEPESAEPVLETRSLICEINKIIQQGDPLSTTWCIIAIMNAFPKIQRVICQSTEKEIAIRYFETFNARISRVFGNIDYGTKSSIVVSAIEPLEIVIEEWTILKELYLQLRTTRAHRNSN